jgi:hypothetical protein
MPLSPEDRWLTSCLLLALALAAGMAGLNAAAFHYTWVSYFPRLSTPLVPLALQFAYVEGFYPRASPRTSFLLKSCALYGLAHIVLAVFVTALQFTPFSPIDAPLQHWDRALGFDTGAVLAWLAPHPRLRFVLDRIYDSTDWQLALAPLVAGFAFDRARMRTFLYAFVYSFIAGGLFYYFFPSSGPGSVYASPYFPYVQRLTWSKFFWVHHSLPVPTMMGGMIAFPSFHVAWSAMLVYAALPGGRRFFWSVAALNALVIASTLVLGWHYLVDVPAGLLLAGLSLHFGRLTHRALTRNSS